MPDSGFDKGSARFIRLGPSFHDIAPTFQQHSPLMFAAAGFTEVRKWMSRPMIDAFSTTLPSSSLDLPPCAI
jgi:hypothetical protein